MPVIPATKEAEAGESLEPESGVAVSRDCNIALQPGLRLPSEKKKERKKERKREKRRRKEGREGGRDLTKTKIPVSQE